MDTATKPIITTTTLSLLVHSMVAVTMLLAYEQTRTQDEGVGRGVEIQLVSSVLVSDQPVADLQVPDMPESTQAVAEVSSESSMHSAEKSFAEKVLTSLNNARVIAATEPEKNARIDINKTEQLDEEDTLQQAVQPQLVIEERVASITQATNASQQQHAIIELLHQRISDNKEYPLSSA